MTESIIVILQVILIDLILSGDNAVVIALATRNVPKDKQKQTIFLGTGAAIVLRFIFAFIVVWLLKIPLLHFVGGLLLVWVAFKLLTDESEHTEIEAKDSMLAAVKTIVVADVVMSLDNVIALVGVAKGNLLIVIAGIIVSIPIIVWSSQILIKFMEKFPIIIYIGAGILTWVAGEMIIEDKIIARYLHGDIWHWAVPVGITVLTLGYGWLKSRQKKEAESEN